MRAERDERGGGLSGLLCQGCRLSLGGAVCSGVFRDLDELGLPDLELLQDLLGLDRGGFDSFLSASSVLTVAADRAGPAPLAACAWAVACRGERGQDLGLVASDSVQDPELPEYLVGRGTTLMSAEAELADTSSVPAVRVATVPAQSRRSSTAASRSNACQAS